MPQVLGIVASHGAGARAGDFKLIETVTVGSGGTSSISFSSIPSTYKHLQLRTVVKSTGVEDSILARFNSDSTYTNYFGRHLLYGDGSSVGSVANNSGSWTGALSGFMAASTTANVFSSSICDILDYGNTNKNKTVRMLSGSPSTVGLASALWLNTNAITSITLVTFGGSNFAQYSRLSLYGLVG